MVGLKILLEKVIKEVGDLENIKPYPYVNTSFTTEQGWKVITNFQPSDPEDLKIIGINTEFYQPPIYNVIFQVEGVESQFTRTTTFEYLKILKTVTEICYDFIRENDPNGLTFFAANKNDSNFIESDPQKHKLYKLIVMKQLLKDSKYKMVDLKIYDRFEGFMIYKK